MTNIFSLEEGALCVFLHSKQHFGEVSSGALILMCDSAQLGVSGSLRLIDFDGRTHQTRFQDCSHS